MQIFTSDLNDLSYLLFYDIYHTTDKSRIPTEYLFGYECTAPIELGKFTNGSTRYESFSKTEIPSNVIFGNTQCVESDDWIKS